MTDTNDSARRAAEEVAVAISCMDAYEDTARYIQDLTAIIQKHFPAAPEGQREEVRCRLCHGEGWRGGNIYDAAGGVMDSVDEDCPDCGGSGKLYRQATAQSSAIPDGWRDALTELESANDAACALRSDAAYQALLTCPGMSDALLSLDRARARARAMLSAAPTPSSPAPASLDAIPSYPSYRKDAVIGRYHAPAPALAAGLTDHDHDAIALLRGCSGGTTPTAHAMRTVLAIIDRHFRLTPAGEKRG